jgi:hypothetical protein
MQPGDEPEPSRDDSDLPSDSLTAAELEAYRRLWQASHGPVLEEQDGAFLLDLVFSDEGDEEVVARWLRHAI